jgi:uncharacterized protein (UPF0335 family)
MSQSEFINAQELNRLRAIIKQVEGLDEKKTAMIAEMQNLYMATNGKRGICSELWRSDLRLRRQNYELSRHEDAVFHSYISLFGGHRFIARDPSLTLPSGLRRKP